MSHKAVAIKPADDPAFQLPASLAGLSLPMIIGGIVALVGGAFFSNSAIGGRFGMSSYLVAYMYCLTLAIGSLFFVLIQHLTRAGWSVVVRRVAELMMIMVIPLALLFIPIAVSAYTGSLYAWSVEGYQADHGVPSAIWEEKERWLNPNWFVVRSLIYLTVWCGIAAWYYRGSQRQDETGEITITEKLQARSGPAVIAFSFCTSFAAFDWVMSLAPMWFSTMFGVYIFTGSILSAHCAICLFSFLLQRAGAMRDEVTVEHYHDLGKLIFGFICFWGYISFSQYMLIWYANIPEETHWFYTRSTDGWFNVSVLLMVLHWGLPFAGTMSRHVRRRPWLITCWAAYILVLHLVDLYWIIMPEAGMGLGGATGIIATLVCVIGMVALMLGLMLKLAAGTRVVAVRDPRLGESLAFENF
ncbi:MULTISPECIES: hypothetical protein [Rhodopirellula]|jgi:hypothetical protein|uniref:Putative membrane protein n=1 Tax=Rhodopirellula europaea SH398 TaxID=1263868 RepID=M5S6N3_9BACT|nr:MULTISPECIES: hypothetical protein [Rhodopirellula]EMI27131.1 putative membrane protein [Rhodopirellula europaea SH398]|tara:strand:- start:203 stop:1444 length:1242 start_codon:yes stop_codon:yes gene_type:complete